ncbi:hypothetical protein AK812_SmicGene15575 [Symbiodinium microadriaticum]|uniref:Uncharacterized protein n=1 Tax=Symbiodinium microadriaticum TaxID=2951 RepID=A0A1Q9E2M1_SYMMI|nr:hypothetical protein AK812_SmicGene15575 [Symbiodinium microadriaticum]
MSSGHCRWTTARPAAGLLILALGRLCGADCTGASCAATGASLLALKAETTAASLGDLEERGYPINMTVNGSNGTVDTQLEMIVGENAEQDMKEMNSIPNPENASSNGTHGMGELARNLEFLMLKIVQLETVVEMQQHEIQDLRSVIGEHFDLDHNDTAASLKQVDPQARTKKAQETLKKVMQKHNHQREKRDFSPEAHRQEQKEELNLAAEAQQRRLLSKREKEAKDTDTVLLEAETDDDDMEEAEQERSSRRRGWPRRRRRLFKAVAKTVSDAGNAVADTASDVAAAANDGTGLVGDALGEAYEHASDQVTFVANTVIDSVEMAVDILVRGFSDWSAGCPDTRTPDMQINEDGLLVDWGRQKCWVRLMGQTCNLFDFNFGSVALHWPEPLKTVIGFGLKPVRSMFNLGADLVSCATSGTAVEVVKCLGFRLIQEVPPLNLLTRMGEMLTEFIEVFAQVATVVVRQVLEDGSSLVQQAAQSKFPGVGEAPVLHHAGKSLTIKTHSQHPKGRKKDPRSKLPRDEKMSALQQDAKGKVRGDDDPEPAGSIAFGVSDQEGNYATRLISQWNGRETDTSSCLAFAPKHREGSNDQALKSDWQGNSDDAFIPLEPFGVPCDNDWMKDHWDKWQGYSFYVWEMAIEKCVTVTFSLGLQPALAFVGGMSFELMPAPLAEMDTTVCWPDKQPGGVDLSVLRSEIRSGGIMLFSRTLRLQKRFGSGTDFVDSNIFGAHETWRNPLGTATGSHGVEDDRTVETMSRSSFLAANQTSQNSQSHQSPKEKPAQRQPPAGEELHWETDLEELYLAAGHYGKDLGIKKTSELRGEDVLKRMRELKAKKGLSTLQADAESGTDWHQLFSFKNPGPVSFEILGLLEDNSLELGMKIDFGPFESPEKRIPLLNIVDQFTLVLGVMPWVSPTSKLKAIASLRDFGKQDISAVLPEVPPPNFNPGSIIGLYNPHWSRWVRMGGEHGDVVDRSGSTAFDSMPSGWTWEKFAVVDAGDGLIALHSPKWNRFLSLNPEGHVYGSPNQAASQLPSDWTWQKFKVVYAGDGMIALHSPKHNRFVTMTDHSVEATNHRNEDSMQESWTWERFQVLRTRWLLQPGTVVGFHNAIHNRYISMGSDGSMHPSPPRDYDEELPESWTWQRFTVVDAGNGEYGLHNAKHNTFWKMTDVATMIASVPKAAPGIGFYNPHHNRMVSLSESGVYASSHRAPQDFPSGWTWQKFKVKLYADAPSNPNDLPWAFSN